MDIDKGKLDKFMKKFDKNGDMKITRESSFIKELKNVVMILRNDDIYLFLDYSILLNRILGYF